MLRLVLLRHGEAVGNRERRFLGLTDEPLTRAGELQAARTARWIPPVEHLYVSPMLRCRQTAGLVWPGVEQTVVSGLRETDFGPFEGKNHGELEADGRYQRWLRDPEDPELAALLESPRAAAQRAGRALTEALDDALARRYLQVGVVSHGGTLMSLLAEYGRPVRPYYDWNMENCGGYLVRWDGLTGLLQVERTLGPDRLN